VDLPFVYFFPTSYHMMKTKLTWLLVGVKLQRYMVQIS
jgi:hypothetical protein